MSSDLKIQGEVSLSTENAESALNRVGDNAAKMANRVKGAADQTGKAVDGIGDGVKNLPEQFTRAESRIVSSIKRSTEELKLLGKAASEKLAFKIDTQGLDKAKFAPYLEQLKQAEAAQNIATGSLNKMGVSAAQTAAALRGVPAQFTDIITSLQGGQAPMTVLLQQGGQLKDMFGGIGPAAKALGGYIVGLVNPFTVAAGAMALVAYQAYRGSEEFSALNKAIRNTGEYTGKTAFDITQMGERIGSSVGSISNANEALTALVATGRVGGSQLEAFGNVAVLMAKNTGEGIDKVVEKLATLGDDAVGFAEKYNKQYHFMTAAQYAFAKQLQDTGDKAGAAKVVIESLQGAQARIAEEAKKNMGAVARWWEEWGVVIDKVSRKLMSIGVPASSFEQINSALSNRESLEKQLQSAEQYGDKERAKYLKGQLDANKAIIDGLRARQAEERKTAAERQKDATAADSQVSLSNYLGDTKYADKKTKYALEVEKENAAFAIAVKGFEKTSKEYEQALARHKANLAQIADSNKDQALSKETSAYAELIASIKEKIAANNLAATSDDKLTDSQKLGIKLDQELTAGKLKLSAAHIAAARSALAELSASENLVKAKQAEKDVTKYIEQSTLARKESADALAVEYQLYGKSNDARAIAMVAIKEQADLEKFLLKEKEDGKKLTEDQIARLQAETKARIENSQSALAQGKALSYAYQLQQENKKFSAESIFDEKGRARALTEIDAEMWRERIQLAGDGTEAQKKLQDQYNTWYANQLAKPAIEEQKKIWESIERTAHDTFVSIFDSGKNAFDRLRDTLKNGLLDLLYQMTVKRWIVSIGASISASMSSSALSGIASAVTGGSGVGASGSGMNMMNMLSMAKTAYSVFSSGLASTIGSGISSAGSMFGSSALQAFGSGMGSSAAGVSAAGAGGAMGAGASFANALPVIGWIAAGMMKNASLYDQGWKAPSINGGAFHPLAGSTVLTDKLLQGIGFGGKTAAILSGSALMARAFGRKAPEIQNAGIEGTFGADGFSGQNFADWLAKGGWFRSDKRGTNYSALSDDTTGQFSDAFSSIKAQTKDFANTLGLSSDVIKGYSKSIRISLGSDAEANKKTIADMFTGIGDDLASLTANFAPFAKEGETSSSTMQRLAGSLSIVNEWMETLRKTSLQASVASGDAASKLIDMFGGLDAMNSATGAFYQTYYSASEQAQRSIEVLQKQFDSMNLSMPETRDQFRQLVLAQDLTTDSGRKTYATLIGMSEAFAQVVKPAEEIAAAIKDAINAVSTLFDSLRDQIKSARDGIGQARESILGRAVMTPEQIAAGISQAMVNAPDASGMINAKNALAPAYANLSTAKQNADYWSGIEKANTSIVQATQQSIADLDASFSGIRAAYEAPKAAGTLEELRKYASLNPLNPEAIAFLAGDLQRFALPEVDTTAKDRQYQADTDAYNARRSALENQLSQQQVQQLSAKSQAEIYAAQVASYKSQVSAAEAAAAEAQEAYSAALRGYVDDAGKAIDKLGKLREETVRYYEAQKQIADAMLASAGNLRSAAQSVRMSQLSQEDFLKQQMADFERNYAMALSTTGTTQAGYADKLTAALPSISQAIMSSANSQYEAASATARLLARSDAVAGLLESGAPKNYQETSLALLDQIDGTLSAIQEASQSAEKIISDAIYKTGESNLQGLHAIVAALTGQTIPAFATGGYHAGGLRIVGENGPELEATGAARIFNAADTRAILSGSGGNESLVSEIRALRADNKAQASAIVQLQSRLTKLLERWDGIGMPETRVVV